MKGMKLGRWLLPALVVGGVVYGARGGCLDDTPVPDQELAGHFAAMCKIARGHIDAPEKGVRKLGHYLGEHATSMFGDVGGTLAIIERIDDDKKHDDRARLARDRIHKPLRACERDWQRFAQAVEADPKAAALVERFGRRLNRTLEIIFSSADAGRAGGNVRLADIPGVLQRAFE